MKQFICYLLLAFFFLTGSAQTAPTAAYEAATKKAFELYQQGSYLESAQAYSEALRGNGGKGDQNTLYNTARSWALAGNKDSAFVYLELVAHESDYANLAHLTADPDLNALHSDSRWEAVTAQVKKNSEEHPTVPAAVRELLDSVLVADQGLRKELTDQIKRYGPTSPEGKELIQRIRSNDSINLKKIEPILEKYGWLGPEDVGSEGSMALFLVIQHASLATQQKYLPMLRAAAQNNKLAPDNLAVLEDRVLVGQGKKQMYGSQVQRDPGGKPTVYPIEDEAHVDERRAGVGLEPLRKYLRRFGIDYQPVQ